MAYEGDYLGRMQRITYPDDEVVTYGYDRGGQIKSVTGRRFTTDFNYVVDVAYDEYGQRSYIEYGNGVHTTYVYDAYRRWLKSIETEYSRNGNSIEYQNIVYQFDAVGNVLGYENKTNRYETSQTYTYDALYQLRTANGRTVNRSEGLGSCPAYTSTYKQTFEFDSIGNMTKKVSTSAVSPKRTIGAGLNYTYDPYDYYAGYPHRLERVGNMYYRYDGNGNVIAEREGGHAQTDSRNATVYNDGDLYYTDYGFGLFQEGQTDTKVYERKYTWNERNLLASSVDRQYSVTYRYGADGQRAAKYAVRGTTSVETMYFNQFWSSRTTATSEMLESKHIFVGTSRVVTKLHRKGDDSVDYEGKNRYYYHSDHLGSAQLVTDFKGLEYERIEYTPYGELWVEKTIAGSERLPFRFTGKEFDEETGLYYYGARYLDPKVSRWLSTDPAVGEYIPSAPVNDEARRRNGNLPGMGGIYNLVNFHLYHYAGNNPVRYIDPDGRVIFDSRWVARNWDNMISLGLNVAEVISGGAIAGATGVSGFGAFMGGMMVIHGSVNTIASLGKIVATTFAADMYGDDYADAIDKSMPDTALGFIGYGIGLLTEAMVGGGYNKGDFAEKAGALMDLLDIACGVSMSGAAGKELTKNIEALLKSSGKYISKANLLKLQTYLESANKVKAAKIIQGIVENYDRIMGIKSNAEQLAE
jgi:RHS repeat-associated protein